MGWSRRGIAERPSGVQARRGEIAAFLAPAAACAAAFLMFRLVIEPAAVDGRPGFATVPILTCAACALVWLPGLAVASLVAGRIPDHLLPAVVVTGSAGAGWLLFWAWFASPTVGWVATGACAVLSVAGFARRPPGTFRRPDLRFGLVAALLIAVAYVALAGDRGGLAGGADMVAHRYWVVVDNKIPEFFADSLIAHRQGLKPTLIGDWLSSDRPPLQTGMMMSVYPVTPAVGRLTAAFLLGVAANALWALGLWSVLLSVSIRRSTAILVVLAVALTGPVFVNTVYTWPKMLAAALILAALAAGLTREVPARVRVIIGGSGIALALLAHGGTLPAVVALSVIVLRGPHRLRPRTLVAAAGVALLIYVPWMGYQHFYDPPGNRLVNWHLAGVVAPSSQSSPHLIAHSYARAGLVGTLRDKLSNLRLLVDPNPSRETLSWWTPGWSLAHLGRMRHLMLTRIGLAPGLLLLGLAALAIPRVRRKVGVGPLASFALLSTLVYVILEYGGDTRAAAWLHTGPFALVVILSALGALGAAALGDRWLVILLIVEAATSGWLWVGALDLQSAFGGAAGHTVVSLDVLAAAALAALALLAWHHQKETEPVEQVAPSRTRADRPRTAIVSEEAGG